MRISDWSSDGCSSDLERVLQADYAVGIVAMRRVLLAESAVVARLLALRHRRLAHRVEFFLRLVGVVRAAGRDHLFGDFAVAIHALRLVDRTFVVVETEPLHRLDRTRTRLHSSH